jgi:hypothetical protein
MGIITYQSLFARACRSWAEGETAPPSKRQKYPAKGLPTVYFAYVFEDWAMAGTAADALGTYGTDIYAEWSAARLFDFDEKAAERLRYQLGLPDTRLVAIISERAKDLDRLLWVLELARETMQRRHYALLPVRYEAMDWNPPPALAAYPRIEERRDDLVMVMPDSTYHLPLGRWLRPRD